MPVYQRDLRYLTGHLWPRWQTVVYAALPLIGCVMMVVGWSMSTPGSLLSAVTNGRKLCAFAAFTSLLAGVVAAPYLGMRLILCEVDEGTLDVLQTLPIRPTRLFLAKARAALTPLVPLWLAPLPLWTLAICEGWAAPAEAVLLLVLIAGITAAVAVFAMATAALVRSPVLAYPAGYLLVGAFAFGVPPLTWEPVQVWDWPLWAPIPALLWRMRTPGLAPVTPLEWTLALGWCAAAVAIGARLGAWLLFGTGAGERTRAAHAVPYALGALAVGGAATWAMRTGAHVAPSAYGIAGGWAVLVPTARLLGWFGTGGSDPLRRKEQSFYETGGLRTLRDAVILAIAAAGLWLAGSPGSWHLATGPGWPALNAGMVVTLFLAMALGATSLTLERSRGTFELLLLSRLPLERIFRQKLASTVRHVLPLLLVAASFGIVGAEADPARWAGVLLALLITLPWLAGVGTYGIAVGGGARNNAQALGACVFVVWWAQALWGPVAAGSIGRAWNFWYVLKAAVHPFFMAEHALTLGQDFPAWHPWGFWGALAAYGVGSGLLFLGVRHAARATVGNTDAWGESPPT